MSPRRRPVSNPLPGLTRLAALPLLSRSYVSGLHNAKRMQVTYYSRDSDGALVAQLRFRSGAEGPPGHVHGGALAAALDEAMGIGAWLSGHQVVAAKLSVEFKRLVPLELPAMLEAWVESAEGRKVTTRGRIVGPDGEAYTLGEGLYVTLAPDRFGSMQDGAG